MILLTGGAGFIGSCLLKKLNDEGLKDIIVVDNLGTSLKWKNLLGKSYLDYINKDKFFHMLTTAQLPHSYNNVETIIHLGACSSTIETNAEYMMHYNFSFSKALAEWALPRKIRMIYASSAATYGNGNLGFSDADELCSKLKPLNIYGYSKQAFDHWAISTQTIRQMVGIKFFNVFGPNENHKNEMCSLIYKAFDQINKQGTIKLFKSHHPQFKDGEQMRDFIYVKDCCEVIWWFYKHPKISGIYNLGTGKAETWNTLANAIFKAMGKEPNIEYIDLPENLRANYQYFTQADMSKVKHAGNNHKFLTIEESVGDYVRNYLLRNEYF